MLPCQLGHGAGLFSGSSVSLGHPLCFRLPVNRFTLQLPARFFGVTYLSAVSAVWLRFFRLGVASSFRASTVLTCESRLLGSRFGFSDHDPSATFFPANFRKRIFGSRQWGVSHDSSFHFIKLLIEANEKSNGPFCCQDLSVEF